MRTVFGLIIIFVASVFIYFNSSSAMGSAVINGALVRIEVADNPTERVRGLSGKEFLEEGEGMLFIFKDSAIRSFWMKEMSFAIDIIWIDKDKRVVGIEQNIPPDTFPQIFASPQPIPYVLEVPAGWAERNNVEVGDLAEINL